MARKGQKSGGDFWGAPAAGSASEAAPVSPVESPAARPNPASGPKSLLALVEPVFRYIADQHRISQSGGTVTFSQVRGEVEQLLKDIEREADQDRGLRAHFKDISLPLLWYVDYWFATSPSFPSVRKEWNDDRLAARDEKNLIGDEAFFNWLDDWMSKEENPGTNEVLAFYYVALGLGFRGMYVEIGTTPEGVRKDSERLLDLMLKMFPRVKEFVDAAPASKITPKHRVDKSDFVRPVREKFLAIFLTILTFVVLIFMGYAILYDQRKLSLEQMINDVGGKIGGDNQ